MVCLGNFCVRIIKKEGFRNLRIIAEEIINVFVMQRSMFAYNQVFLSSFLHMNAHEKGSDMGGGKLCLNMSCNI